MPTQLTIPRDLVVFDSQAAKECAEDLMGLSRVRQFLNSVRHAGRRCRDSKTEELDRNVHQHHGQDRGSAKRRHRPGKAKSRGVVGELVRVLAGDASLPSIWQTSQGYVTPERGTIMLS